jgi:hypothetical protein
LYNVQVLVLYYDTHFNLLSSTMRTATAEDSDLEDPRTYLMKYEILVVVWDPTAAVNAIMMCQRLESGFPGAP